MAELEKKSFEDTTPEKDDNEEKGEDDLESVDKKYPYPKSIGFIITNEFCERFSYYGMRTILVIYLKSKLLYSEDDSIVIYHVFTMFVYFFPIFGAMIADSWLGRFKTIFSLSIIYAIGNILISVTAMPLGIPLREFTIIGLLLVAIGTGGIKPCVSAFGGDQFRLPQQAAQLATFFSLFYFAINAGSFISTFVTPILRADVTCFDENDCYSLAFGVPGILMIVSIGVFVLGKPLYIMKKPAGNVLLEVSKCIGHAISRRRKLKKEEKRDHWLDYADDKFEKSQRDDIKAALKVLLLFLPLPVFWALFDQQGSRWTFQATRMDGTMGDFVLKPDQMQVVNPMLILIFIPLFEVAIYPALKWCRIVRKPLHKMVVGGLLAAVAFVISGIIELELETTYPVLPSAGINQFRVYNGYNCDLAMKLSFMDKEISLKGLEIYEDKNVEVIGKMRFNYSVTGCDGLVDLDSYSFLEEKKAKSFFIRRTNSKEMQAFDDDSDKMSSGYPAFRFMVNNKTLQSLHVIDTKGSSKPLEINTTTLATLTRHEVVPSEFEIKLGDKVIIKNLKAELGGVYAVNIWEEDESKYNVAEMVKPNSMHMMWLLPQYIVLTMAEVMFSVTGLEFSFTQAPSSMKSVLTAGWLLTVAFGNLIVVIVAEAKGFDSQASEFFLFAGLMLVDIIIFWLMTLKYKYVDEVNKEPEEDSEPQAEKLGLDNIAFNQESNATS